MLARSDVLMSVMQAEGWCNRTSVTRRPFDFTEVLKAENKEKRNSLGFVCDMMKVGNVRSVTDET